MRTDPELPPARQFIILDKRGLGEFIKPADAQCAHRMVLTLVDQPSLATRSRSKRCRDP
jgi:hypothetical protein